MAFVGRRLKISSPFNRHLAEYEPEPKATGDIDEKGTWYDDVHCHIVCLVHPSNESKKAICRDGVIAKYFQIFKIPAEDKAKVYDDVLDDATSRILSSEISNAEHNSKKRSDGTDRIVEEQIISANDPRILVCLPESKTWTDKSYPILVKFSLDMKLLAVQTSPTEVHIVSIGEFISTSYDTLHMGCNKKVESKHWTINLEMVASGIISVAGAATFSSAVSPRRINAIKDRNDADDINVKSTNKTISSHKLSVKILRDGVIWSDHGGKSQDLILITSSTIFFYKVSISRNQMAISRKYTHPSDAYWYDPVTRALVIGSFSQDANLSSADLSCIGGNVEGVGMVMRTYFLRFPDNLRGWTSVGDEMSLLGSSSSSSAPYSFRFELPPPDRLPLFFLGRLPHFIEGSSPSSLSNTKLTGPANIQLMIFYGEPYCMEVSLDAEGTIVKAYHLDKAERKVYLAKTFRVDCEGPHLLNVLDNLLCIHSITGRRTLFFDVEESGEDPICKGTVTAACTSINACDELYNGRWQFLRPNFLYDHGRGRLIQLFLHLPKILGSTPSSANVLPFLLRRRESYFIGRVLSLERLSKGMKDQGITNMYNPTWTGHLVDVYGSSEDVCAWDMEACLPLLHRAAFLPPITASSPTCALSQVRLISSKCPRCCEGVLTQSEVLETILLPKALNAIVSANCSKLQRVCELSLEFHESLSQRSIVPCPALTCLCIALLWRLGYGSKAIYLLPGLQLQGRQRSLTNKGDREGEGELERNDVVKVRTVALAETLILIVTEVEYGINGKRSANRLDSLRHHGSYKEAIITHSIDMLCWASSRDLAAKHLLKLGRVMDAINVIDREASFLALSTISPKDQAASFSASMPGVGAVDFFRATILRARSMAALNDRAHLFHHLFAFLTRWDPSSISVLRKNRNVPGKRLSKKGGQSVGDEFQQVALYQSELATLHPEFPDDLFGGQHCEVSRTVRQLFGYSPYPMAVC